MTNEEGLSSIIFIQGHSEDYEVFVPTDNIAVWSRFIRLLQESRLLLL